MSFTGDLIDNKLWCQFDYYSDLDGEDGVIADSLSSPDNNLWKLEEIRLHFSTAFASVEDFVVRVSSGSAINSYFNLLIVSQAMNGVQDLQVLFNSNPLLLRSDENLTVGMSMASGVNLCGIRVIGWAVRG